MTKRLSIRLFVALALGAACLQQAQAQSRQAFLLTGQSNSLGAVKGSPASPELLQQYASEGRLWNGNMNRDTGECFEKNQQWQTVAPQLPRYNGSPCMGPEYGFAAMLQRLRPGMEADIVKASLDGGGNHYWLPGGNAYKTLLDVAKRAMKAQKKQAPLTALLYLQGESDAGEEVTLARKRLEDLFKNLRKDLKKAGVNTSSLKFCVVGEPATWHGEEKTVGGTTTAAQLRKLADSKKEFAWVRTRDLTKITSGDQMGVHYDGKAQITIGARFACALLALQGKVPAGLRGDANAPLDRPAAWWGGKAPDKETVATWNVASANDTDLLARPLAAKGLLIDDPFADTVTVQGGGDKSASVLALGEAGIELRGADLKLQGVRLLLPARARIFSGSGKGATLSGGSLQLTLAAEELEPAGPGAYSTRKLGAARSVSGAVELRLEAPAAEGMDILFLQEDGSPVDFSAAKPASPALRIGDPGHLLVSPARQGRPLSPGGSPGQGTPLAKLPPTLSGAPI